MLLIQYILCYHLCCLSFSTTISTQSPISCSANFHTYFLLHFHVSICNWKIPAPPESLLASSHASCLIHPALTYQYYLHWKQRSVTQLPVASVAYPLELWAFYGLAPITLYCLIPYFLHNFYAAVKHFQNTLFRFHRYKQQYK